MLYKPNMYDYICQICIIEAGEKQKDLSFPAYQNSMGEGDWLSLVPYCHVFFFFSMFLLILRERERLPPVHTLTRDRIATRACVLRGIDLVSWWPFSAEDNTQPTEHTAQGHIVLFNYSMLLRFLRKYLQGIWVIAITNVQLEGRHRG